MPCACTQPGRAGGGTRVMWYPLTPASPLKHGFKLFNQVQERVGYKNPSKHPLKVPCGTTTTKI